MQRALVVYVVAAFGCVESGSVPCSDGRVCPSGTVCRTVRSEQLCVAPAQIASCTDIVETELCTLADSALARCYDGVCVDATCGNLHVDIGEVCDDGNSVVGDGCSSECQSLEVCGNQIIDPVTIVDDVAYADEKCDDANVIGRDGCSSDCQVEAAAWEQIVIGAPPPRFDAAVAYDSARQRVVMFGGATPAGGVGPFSTRGDTWEWDGGGWASVPTASVPNVRAGSVMAYDAERRRVILFGGTASSDPGAKLGDTWDYDGTRWALLQPAHAPPARAGAAGVYDAKRRRIVMFGGKDATGAALDDTWVWDGQDWSELSAAVRPSARSDCAIAYDPKRDVVVLAGGNAAETWLLDAAGWRNATPAVATDQTDQIAGFAMAYDAVLQQVIAFGGRTTSGASLDTWGWDGTRWTRLLVGNGPPFRLEPAMIGDPTRGNIVLFGGQYSSGCPIAPCMQPRNDTWVWAGGGWQQVTVQAPPMRGTVATALDSARGRLVVFGGEDELGNVIGDTWELAGGHWQAFTPTLPPTARRGATMAFDAARGVTVLFGGEDNIVGELADTWTWNGSDWTKLTPADSPPKRKDAAMAYDPVRGRMVLFGGYAYQSVGTGVRDDTWEWDGTNWKEVVPATRPTARVDADAAWDPIRRRVVLVLGDDDYLSEQSIRETWEWDGVTWTKVASAPPSRSFAAVAWNAPRGRLQLFGGETIRTGLSDTWELTAAGWTQVVPLALPAGRWGHSMTTSPDGTGVIAFAGSLAVQNVTADIWRLRWTSAQRYELCTLDVDHDSDGLAGCADPDCWAACTPVCPPAATCDPTWPRCGDAVCNTALENCHLCPQDCGCSAVCGDNFCDAPETATSCPGDC